MAFNRNIITDADIENLLDPNEGTPKTLDDAPPAGTIPTVQPPAPAGQPPAAPGAIKVPKSDDYLTKILKYIPLEVLGAYLFVEDLITTNVDDKKELQTWLFWTLVVLLAVTVIYEMTVLNIVRTSQVAMGALGLAVYVFATGGWFATTSWYEDWFSGIALVAFAFIVAVIKLPELPTE